MLQHEYSPDNNPELLLPNEDPVITAELDRGWMVALGCEWPNEEQEAEWLEEKNLLRATGSTIITPSIHSGRGERQLEDIVNSRHHFFKLFSSLGSDFFTKGRYGESRSYATSIPLDTFIVHERYVHLNGLDNVKIQRNNPHAATFSWHSLHERLTALRSLGVNVSRMVSSTKQSNYLSLSPGSIYERALPLYAAARAQGIDDPKSHVNNVIESWPEILTYRPDRARLLSRVIMLTAQGEEPNIQEVRQLFITKLEAVTAAYLIHGDHIRSIHGLLYHAGRYVRGTALGLQGPDVEALKGIIVQYPDDPVASRYLRAYPIDDPIAVAARYLRHIRARERHKHDHQYPLLWQGPSVLGDPVMPPSHAYTSVIESEPLSDGQIAELAALVRSAGEADRQLRDLSVAHNELEIAGLSEAVNNGSLARKALIARHLGLVVEIVDSCFQRISKIDLIGIGNIGLSEYFIEEFDPEVDMEGEKLRGEVAAAIMRKLTSYSPRYQNKSHYNLQKESAKAASD